MAGSIPSSVFASPFANMGMNAMGPPAPQPERLGFPQFFYTNDPHGSIGGPGSLFHPAALAGNALAPAVQGFLHLPGVLPPSGNPMDNPILHALNYAQRQGFLGLSHIPGTLPWDSMKLAQVLKGI